MKRGPRSLYRRWATAKFLATRDRAEAWQFLRDRDNPLPVGERLALLWRYIAITDAVRGYHTLGEMLTVAAAILSRSGERPLTVVEAGAAYGSSTAKLSLAVSRAGGTLHVFDSFRGIPDNDEVHENLFNGKPVRFFRGAFDGSLAKVRRNVSEHGSIDHCEFYKGWLADTLPTFPETEIDVILLDVDLVESTRVCVRELFPRLRGDGILYSQDGQLRATHELFGDASFWRDEVGVEPPIIEGLGRDKLLIVRPAL